MFWYGPVDWAANIGMRTSGTQFRVSSCHDNGLKGPGAHALDLDLSSRDLSNYRQQLRHARAVDIDGVCLYRRLILRIFYLNCEAYRLCGVRYTGDVRATVACSSVVR